MRQFWTFCLYVCRLFENGQNPVRTSINGGWLGFYRGLLAAIEHSLQQQKTTETVQYHFVSWCELGFFFVDYFILFPYLNGGGGSLYFPWVLKRGGLETSCSIADSLYLKTKRTVLLKQAYKKEIIQL